MERARGEELLVRDVSKKGRDIQVVGCFRVSKEFVFVAVF